ncbi:hypothetical protein GCM10010429_38650 [Micromonospora olivasterospora]
MATARRRARVARVRERVQSLFSDPAGHLSTAYVDDTVKPRHRSVRVDQRRGRWRAASRTWAACHFGAMSAHVRVNRRWQFDGRAVTYMSGHAAGDPRPSRPPLAFAGVRRAITPCPSADIVDIGGGVTHASGCVSGWAYPASAEERRSTRGQDADTMLR